MGEGRGDSSKVNIQHDMDWPDTSGRNIMEEQEVFRFWLCSVFSYNANKVLHLVKFGAISVNKPKYIV